MADAASSCLPKAQSFRNPVMQRVRYFLLACACLMSTAASAERLTIAAAANLKWAMDEVIAAYQQTHAGSAVDVIYGSSGKLHAQIRNGAPFDMYFSADMAYPRALAEAGFAASQVRPYALGRIVLWSASRDVSRMTMQDLADPEIERIAMANPRHAPYGKRAEEALRATGVWDKVESRLVYGESIAQAAQFVHTGNAQVGIIALAMALSPELAGGSHWLIPDDLHEPLEQGFIITRRAEDNAAARRFANFMGSEPARAVLLKHGFALPDTQAAAGLGSPLPTAGGLGERGTAAATADALDDFSISSKLERKEQP